VQESEIGFRVVTPEDADALVVLFKACFSVDVDARYFGWKYFENPAGEVVAYVADAGDGLAAFYGVIPEPWSVRGEPLEVHQSMDTMTHPAFRRRGLFSRLAELTYEEVRARTGPIRLVGIPGLESLAGFTHRLGWSKIHEFDLIGVPAVVARARPRLKPDRVSIEIVTEPDERVHAVLNEAPLPDAVFPRLVGEFFDWRVFGHSPKRLRVALASDCGAPVAVCVYALAGPRSTMISYVGSVSGVPRREWFSPLLRFVAGQGGALLYTWRPQRPGLAALYRSAGFRATPFRSGPLSESRPLIVKSDAPTVHGVDWKDPSVFDLQPLMQD
jgi:GNAT superfamily N-acetyltransferase